METFWVDYNHYGSAERITIPLRRSKLKVVAVGDTVTVQGDEGIPDRRATVLSITGRYARLEFVDSL